MILKIFTKRLKGGKPMKTNLDWIDSFTEAEEITTRHEDEKAEICLICDESTETKTVNLDTHGYEIYNNAGAMVKKHVTALKEGEATV